MARPIVRVIGTGGTISCSVDDPLDTLDYFDGPEPPTFADIATVVSRVPSKLGDLIDIQQVPFSAGPSMSFGPDTWFKIASCITQEAETQPDIAGFVITHGTATLEETAFALSLVLKITQPVCLVGAQLPSSAVGFDGTANLVAGIRVAAEQAARHHGVLVVMNNEVHAARDVVKTSCYRVDTFRSSELGPLGVVDGDGVHFFRQNLRKHTVNTDFSPNLLQAVPRVDIVYSYAGGDGTAIEAFVKAGAAGIISCGMLPGVVTPGEKIALQEASLNDVVIVQSSRAVRGRVAHRWALREGSLRNFISSGDLPPVKARILLMLALSRTKSIDEIQAIFDTH